MGFSRQWLWYSYILMIMWPTTNSLNSSEMTILRNIVEYFQPDFLDILDDAVPNNLSSFVGNLSYPPREMILTSQLTPRAVMLSLSENRTRRGGFSLVVAEFGTSAWNSFIKVIDFQTLQRAKWIVFSSSPLESAVTSGLYIPFDCQFIIVNTAGSLPILTEVYHIARGEPLKTAHFGYWTPESGLATPKTYFYQRRPNLQGVTFNAIIKTMPPYTYVNKFKNGTVAFGGYFYEVWKELEFRMKFKTNFTILGRGEKIIAALQKPNFTFCITPVLQDPTTINIAGLTEPIYEPKIYLFGRRPGSELEWNSYLKPFSTQTWLTVLGWLVGSAAAMSFLYSLAWKHRAAEPDAGYYVFTFSVCLETVFRAACAQGSDVTPRSLSCRTLFLSVYMTALVLTSAFSAALFSLLTVPVSREPFSSFKQVIATNNYKLGIIPETDVYQGIKDLAEKHPNSDRHKLFRMVEPTDKLPTRVEEALIRICGRTDYIFMWDLPTVQLRMQNISRICQESIMPGGPMVFNEHMGFATSKHSPYKGLIDLHLVRMKNEGVLYRLLVNTWPPQIPNVQTTWVRVTINDISPILYMYATGVILGVTLLVIERARRKESKYAQQRDDSSTLMSRRLGMKYDKAMNKTLSRENTDLHYRYRAKDH